MNIICMLDYLGTFFLTGVGSVLFENMLHRFAHNPKSGTLYKWHRIHHAAYPPSRPMSTVYINQTEENVFFQFYLLCMGFMYFLLPLHLFLFSTVQFTVYGYLGDRVHKQIHILGSPLEKYSWFRTLRKNHIYHHNHNTERFSILFPR